MPPHLPDNGTREPDDDPVQDGEMASRRYSLDEAAEALGCHPMTLRRWLRTVDRDIEPEREDRDRRFKWLTQQQVTTLGRRHRQGRLGEPTQDHTAARLADLERRIEELEAALAALRGSPERPERAQVRVDTDEGEAPWQPLQPRKAVPTRPLGSVTSLPVVPEGWIPWSRFAREIGVSRWTVQTAVHGSKNSKPRLAFHRGAWRTAGPSPVRVTELFDPEQQEEARRHFGR